MKQGTTIHIPFFFLSILAVIATTANAKQGGGIGMFHNVGTLARGAHNTRDGVKGSKGTKGKDSKKKKSKKESKYCKTHEVIFKDEDYILDESVFISWNEDEAPQPLDTQAVYVPFYDTDHNVLGVYESVVTALPVPPLEEFVDCSYTASYSFFDEEGLFSSQIAEYGTCYGENDMLTGGQGDYACATGTDSFLDYDEDAGIATYELYVCTKCS